ncbi:MAG: hypothetical protein ACJ8AO_17270 [Gemmatimonadaceae bacterium]
MRLRFIPQMMVVLTAAACASGSPATSNAPHRHTSRTVLTGDEMREARVVNAFEAVERLRPEFMRARGAVPRSPFAQTKPGVFHNGVYLGGLEMLRSFSPLEVVAIRRLSASETTILYGSRYGNMEALEVVTSTSGRTTGR